MNQAKHILPLLTLVFLLMTSCQNNSTSTASGNEATSSSQNSEGEAVKVTPEPATGMTKEMRYAWVDKLNIRDQPNVKGKAIAAADSEEALEYTGGKSDKAETIVLRGVAYHDYWYKIIKADGKEGWVFGGAVKQMGEQKGNAALTEMQFDYPKFGKYDLSNWQLIEEKKLGEEVDGKKKSYKSSEYQLNISNPSMGEFGYSFTQALLTATGKLIKEREFNFRLSDTEGVPHELIETIKDYEQKPAKKYTRTQKIDKHYYSLNAKPMMVLGEWKEETIDE